MQQVSHIIDYFDALVSTVPCDRKSNMRDLYLGRGVRYAELEAGYRDHMMQETEARRRILYGPLQGD